MGFRNKYRMRFHLHRRKLIANKLIESREHSLSLFFLFAKQWWPFPVSPINVIDMCERLDPQSPQGMAGLGCCLTRWRLGRGHFCWALLFFFALNVLWSFSSGQKSNGYIEVIHVTNHLYFKHYIWYWTHALLQNRSLFQAICPVWLWARDNR